MPSINMSGIKPVTDFQTDLTELKQRLLSVMQDQGEIFTTKIADAKNESWIASKQLDSEDLSIGPTFWGSIAGRKAQELVNALKGRSATHYTQRIEQYAVIDNAANEISALWNS